MMQAWGGDAANLRDRRILRGSNEFWERSFVFLNDEGGESECHEEAKRLVLGTSAEGIDVSMLRVGQESFCV